MKKYFSFITGLFCCIAIITSCSDDDNFDKKHFTGSKVVEMKLDSEKGESQTMTKGLIDDYTDFDMHYDPDYIYLHKKDSNEFVKFPVYEDNCDGKNNCEKCFRYHIDVHEDGSAVITPLNADDEPISESLTLAAGDSVYFSSEEFNVWELGNEQVVKEGENIKYHRQKDINKEMYRSSSNYSIAELTKDNDLTIRRGCAGFNVVGLFFDNDTFEEDEDGYKYATLSERTFEEVMESPYSEWYIKIVIGGDNFTDKFDFSTNKSVGINTGGFYASADSTLYSEGTVDKSNYLPLARRTYGTPRSSFRGYGYYTADGNQLFTPVTGESVDVYILIKHWTGGAEGPDDEWLLDDTGALRTKVNLSGYAAPINNNFYIIGLLIDVHQFKAAWDAAGGDAASEEAAGAASIASKGLSTAGVRDFTLPDAKVVFEAY